jgi:hypothetical protein
LQSSGIDAPVKSFAPAARIPTNHNLILFMIVK